MITLEKKHTKKILNFKDTNSDFSDIENLDSKLLKAEIDFETGKFMDMKTFVQRSLKFKNNLLKNV